MDVLQCPNCNRSVASVRFVPHLEKCLGLGRASSHRATRRIAAMRVDPGREEVSGGGEKNMGDLRNMRNMRKNEKNMRKICNNEKEKMIQRTKMSKKCQKINPFHSPKYLLSSFSFHFPSPPLLTNRVREENEKDKRLPLLLLGGGEGGGDHRKRMMKIMKIWMGMMIWMI